MSKKLYIVSADALVANARTYLVASPHAGVSQWSGGKGEAARFSGDEAIAAWEEVRHAWTGAKIEPVHANLWESMDANQRMMLAKSVHSHVTYQGFIDTCQRCPVPTGNFVPSEATQAYLTALADSLGYALAAHRAYR